MLVGSQLRLRLRESLSFQSSFQFKRKFSKYVPDTNQLMDFKRLVHPIEMKKENVLKCFCSIKPCILFALICNLICGHSH